MLFCPNFESLQAPSMPPSFNTLDYSLDHHPHHHHVYSQNQQEQQHLRVGETSGENNTGMVDYMPQITQPSPPPPPPPSSGFYGSTSFDKLSFADVMQFADFGPKLALNQTKNGCDVDQSGIDPVYFLKFPVLNDKMMMMEMVSNNNPDGHNDEERFNFVQSVEGNKSEEEEETTRVISDHDNNNNNNNNNSVVQEQVGFLGGEDHLVLQKKSYSSSGVQDQNNNNNKNNNNKRKRPRTVKTSEEVESQRMTHIAVERNRRKQMNEHLRVLRSLMPGSYVQRGDQASIIGGAIEFVRELEQLLQCLESQKRRRLLGDQAQPTIRQQVGDNSAAASQQPPFFPPVPLPNDQMKLVELESTTGGLREETAESKSCLADVEVKLLGFDAMIKILSRRRPGQLIKTIAALEDMQLIILHTNITTIEQTVLYSFNVKVASDSRFTAEDIASSVQQILSFIHANTGM